MDVQQRAGELSSILKSLDFCDEILAPVEPEVTTQNEIKDETEDLLNFNEPIKKPPTGNLLVDLEELDLPNLDPKVNKQISETPKTPSRAIEVVRKSHYAIFFEIAKSPCTLR